MKHVVIVGGGFAGLNAAKLLGSKNDFSIMTSASEELS